MITIKIKNIGGFSIGHTDALNDEDIEGIMDVLHKPVENAESILGGRRKINMFTLANGQAVAVKQYARGGLVHLLVKETYLQSLPTELQFLDLEISEPMLVYPSWKENQFYLNN